MLVIMAEATTPMQKTYLNTSMCSPILELMDIKALEDMDSPNVLNMYNAQCAEMVS